MYDLLVLLSRPSSLLFLAAGLAWVHARHRGSDGPLVRRWWLLWLVLFYLYLTPAVSYLAVGSLEWQVPSDPPEQAAAEAIVILSGGAARDERLPRQAALACDSVARCLRGAELARRWEGIPVVVSGGVVDPRQPGPPLSQMMRDLLLDLGVDAERVVEESESTSTHENALYTARLLRDEGISRIVLVTDATHMPRARRCFQSAGLEVVPAATRRRALSFGWSPYSFLPSSHAAEANDAAVHEWIGLAWYRLRGRL